MKIVFLSQAGDAMELPADPGLSVMEILRRNDLLAGECNGSLACSSCHVWVDAGWADRLDPPEPAEEDLLDVTFNLAPTSRLCCQIMFSPALDGLTVAAPQRAEAAA